MAAAPPAQGTASILVKSAQGATFLILLQIGSRALTFIVNQVLLRFLSPEVLGVSTQLELFAASVLFFARESLRVALQRQHHHDDQPEPAKEKGKGGDGGSNVRAWNHGLAIRAQEVVNLSYLAIALGLPLTYVFARLYLGNASTAVLGTDYIHMSMNVYAIATVLELFSEPSFAIAQQEMLYGTRASAETFATSARCLITCGTAIWASKKKSPLGALPFALGQLGYAIILNIVYLVKISYLHSETKFSLAITRLPTTPNLLFSRFPLPVLNLASNLYAQSVLKHILTSGDALLITALTSLSSQGAYALASNYGSLIARIIFQPIEESSRSLFGRLLPSQTKSLSPAVKPTPLSSGIKPLHHAINYLVSLIHLYSLLSLIAVSLGPSIAPLLLRFIAGPRWSATAAPSVLAAYCYYIPLLALNGILEAFVSAVATPAQLREQSAWMLAFSIAFATTGVLVLKVWDLGARGLILVNAVNMVLRIWWSWGFAKEYFRERGLNLKIADTLPNPASSGGAIVASMALQVAGRNFHGGTSDFLKWVGVATLFGSIL
ncbi:Oligosaccharide translocation protein rft1 [Peltigera leucophlebia]|nr:Oligosaccharide translocation protein rft1 [Peltigera leucophlebia]